MVTAIADCVDAGGRILKRRVTLVEPSSQRDLDLGAVLNCATRRRTIIVAALGNQRMIGSTVIPHHPLVIPVMALDQQGWSCAT